MAKKPIDSSGLKLLCREFLLAVNEHSEGRLFKNWEHFDPRRAPDYAVQRCRDIFRDGFFQASFPAQFDQDLIGRTTLKNSGVDYRSVKNALKAEGLDVLVGILGRANSHPS